MATSKPDLTRVWASNADPSNVVDPDTTTPGKVNTGWQAEVPPFEHFNYLQKWFSQGLAHFNEQGIGVWDTNTTYPIGGLAKGSNGELYESVVEQSGNDPVSDDGTNWCIFYLEEIQNEVNNPKPLRGSNDEIVVLASGQSNCLGRFGGGDNTTNNNVFTWDINASAWEVATPSTKSYITDMGGGDSWGNTKNNIAFQFCKKLQESTGKTVYLILNAKGGAGIEEWITGGYNTTLKNTVVAALAASGAPTRQTVDYFLWIQGENDLKSNRSFEYYSSRFETLIGDLNGQVWYDISNAVVVAPTVGRQYLDNNFVRNNSVNEYLSGLGVSQPDVIGCSVSVSSANTTYGDDDHYDGKSLVDIGNRAFQSVARETDNSNRTSVPIRAGNVLFEYENQNYFGGEFASGAGFQANFDINNWGAQNFVNGYAAGINIISAGVENLVFGTNALRGFDTIGANNVVFTSLKNSDITTSINGELGDQNTLVGSRILNHSISPSADRNTLLGTNICFDKGITIGSFNLFAGSNVARASSIASYNVLLGDTIVSNSLTALGGSNVGIGRNALGGSATSGTLGAGDTRHVCVGAYAGGNLNTDSATNNGVTLIGERAGFLMQDTNAATALQNVTCLGGQSKASGNNQVQLGDSRTTTYAYGAVQDRSDKRDKTEIKDLTESHINFFMDIEWKQYRLNYRDNYIDYEEYEEEVEVEVDEPVMDGELIVEIRKVKKKQIVMRTKAISVENDGSRAGSRFHIGAIAQQVEAAMKKHDVDFAGLQHHSINGGVDVYTIGYQEFIGIQGEIIQRQQKRINSIEARLDNAGI